jgi:amino acid permease
MINQWLTIMSTPSSIGGVLVWASQCLAYIRYHRWFHDHKRRKILPPEYNRWEPQPSVYAWHQSRTILASFQPIPAWIGLVACLLVVFVFSTADFWNGKHITFTKVATAYAGVSVLGFRYLLWLLTIFAAGDTSGHFLPIEITQQEAMG